MIKQTRFWEQIHSKTQFQALMIMEDTSHHRFEINFYKEKVLL